MNFRIILLHLLPLSLFANFGCEYDNQNRLTKFHTKDSGTIHYFYNESSLTHIVRQSPNGELVYIDPYACNLDEDIPIERLIAELENQNLPIPHITEHTHTNNLIPLVIPLTMGLAAAAEACLDALVLGIAAWLTYEAVEKGNEMLTQHRIEQEQLEPNRLFEDPEQNPYYLSNPLVYGTLYHPAEFELYLQEMERVKTKNIKADLPKTPDELEKKDEWKEITPKEVDSSKHRKFKNEQTEDEWHFDKGNPADFGHKGEDHWHWLKRNENGKYDYFDKHGNKVPRGSEASHLYPPT